VSRPLPVPVDQMQQATMAIALLKSGLIFVVSHLAIVTLALVIFATE